MQTMTKTHNTYSRCAAGTLKDQHMCGVVCFSHPISFYLRHCLGHAYRPTDRLAAEECRMSRQKSYIHVGELRVLLSQSVTHIIHHSMVICKKFDHKSRCYLRTCGVGVMRNEAQIMFNKLK